MKSYKVLAAIAFAILVQCLVADFVSGVSVVSFSHLYLFLLIAFVIYVNSKYHIYTNYFVFNAMCNLTIVITILIYNKIRYGRLESMYLDAISFSFVYAAIWILMLIYYAIQSAYKNVKR